MSSYKELSKMVKSGQRPATAASEPAVKQVSTSYMAEKVEREQQPAVRVPVGNTSRKQDRQQRLEQERQKSETARKRDQAQLLYDTYVQSDEYKQNLSAANRKAQEDRWMTAAITGSTDTIMQPIKDRKEQELKAMVDHYTAQLQKEESQQIMDADLQELEGWDEQDRAALETYIINRNQEFATNMNPMTDGTFGQQAIMGSQALIQKYGLKKVNQMAESLERAKNAEATQAAETAGREGADSGFWGAVGHNAASVGANAVGGLTGLMGYLQELGQRTGRYSTMDPNNIGNLPAAYAGGVRAETAENISGDVYDENGNLISDGGALRQLGAYAYQGGMSAADSMARALLGGGAAGGAALAATGSFTQALSEASAQGATPGEAAALATVTAGIEYLSEKIPLDNLVDAAKAGGHGAKEIVKNALLQGGIEATTEEISLISTTLAEAAILKEKAGYRQRINELVAGGTPLAEAQKTATQELLQEAVDTAVVSFLSGGMSEVGASVAGNLTHRGMETEADGEQMQAAADETAADAEQIQEGAGPELTEQEQFERDNEKSSPVYEELVKKADIPVIGVGRNASGKTYAELKNDVLQIAEFGNWYEAPYTNKDTKMPVFITKRSFTHSFSRLTSDFGTDTLLALQKMPELIQEAVLVNVAPPKNPNKPENRVMTFIAAIESDNGVEPVKITVKEYDGNDGNPMPKNILDYFRRTKKAGKYNSLYDLKALEVVGIEGAKKELGASAIVANGHNGPSTNSTPNSTIRVADLLGLVKGDAEKYIPKPNEKRDGVDVEYKKAGSIATPESVQADSFTPVAPGGTAPRTEVPQSTNTAGPGATPEAESTVAPEGATQSTDISSPGATSEIAAARTSTNSVPQSEGEVNGNIDENRAQEVDTQEASVERGQLPETKTAYETVMENGSIQPDRADDVRKMAMPETDINGREVSAVAANVYGSKITPDDFAELMKEPAARGDFSYAKITNDQATERAKETISRSETWENAYKDWSDQVAQGIAGAEMSARGALLLNRAAQQGNKGEWLNILADMQRLGTNTAQGLQAFRIIRSLNPADKTVLIKNQVRRMVRDMRLGNSIEVDETLLDKYVKAKTDADRDAILEEIQQDIADQIPSTALDKFTALRYMNMLGNLKTNVRNVAGNVAMKGVYKVKDTIAASVEEILSAATGGKFQRTKSLTVSRELREACKADFAQYAAIVSDGGKYGDSRSAGNKFAQGVMDKRRIFKGDVKTGNERFDKTANKVIDMTLAPAEAYRKGTNWMMNNKYFGDEAFGRGAYARAMAGYLKANGVKDTDLSKVDDALLDKARTYAIREAQEATFHDNTAAAQLLQGMLRGKHMDKVKGARAVSEGIVPFIKTPANILTRAEEFSPLGLINSTVKTIQAAKKDSEITGADIVNSWAKTLTGTGLFALGMLMGDQGWLTGGADDDEDEAAFDKLNGEQEYALVMPDGQNYTLDWLGPSVMPMFMGVELMKAIEEAGGLEDLTFADLETVLTSVSDPMIQMSMLSGLNDSLDNIKYSDNSLAQFLMNGAVSYLTQGLANTLLGQMEKSSEEVRTQTYIDKDSQVPAWMQKQLGSLSQKIPGWDYQQTPYIDAKGQEQEQPTGVGGWLYNLISPGYLNKKEVDSVSEELYRLNETGAAESNVFLDSPSTTFSYTDKDGVLHEGYNLSDQEAETLKRSVGEKSVEVLKALFESDAYKAMTDQQKADAVEYVYDYAREKGRSEAVEGYQGMREWMQGIEGKEADVIANKAITAAFSDAFSLLDNDPEAAGKALDQAYSLIAKSPTKGNSIMRDAGGKTEMFIQAARMGIDGKTFTNLYSKYQAIGENKSLDTTQKAQEWAHTLQKAKENGIIKSDHTVSKLKDIMEFRYSMPAETDKYDLMVEQGVDSDNADWIVGLLDGIQGTGTVDKDTGKARVTDADKRQAIATSGLPDKELDTVMKAYMTDYDPKAANPNYTELKYDYIRQELGYSAEQYAKAYRITSGDGKKNQKIADIKKDIGITDAQARELYGIMNLSKNQKKDLLNWAEELYG